MLNDIFEKSIGVLFIIQLIKMEGFDFIDGKRPQFKQNWTHLLLTLLGNSGESSQTMPNFGGPPMNMEMGFDIEEAGKGF